MKKYFKTNEWQIIQEHFDPTENRFYESIMSLGNGYMGFRGNFEEDYSGDSLQGTYIAGIYFWFIEDRLFGRWVIFTTLGVGITIAIIGIITN